MNLRTFGLFVFVLVGALMFSTVVSAADAIIRTQPLDSEWIADGTTEYQVDIWVDNSPLNGEGPTRGVEWKLMVPNELEPYVSITRVKGDSGNPPDNDFFAGKNMVFELVDTIIERLQSRLAAEGDGVVGQGNVASYWFTVSPQEGIYGQKQFDLSTVTFFADDGNNTAQPFVVENDPFVVLNPNGGMVYYGITPGIAGQRNDFIVNGAGANNMVYYVYGFQSGSKAVPGCPGLYVDIRNPTIMGNKRADANGDVVLSKMVPSGARNKAIKFQAVDVIDCEVTDVIDFTFS